MRFGKTALRFAVVLSLQLPVALAARAQITEEEAPAPPPPPGSAQGPNAPGAPALPSAPAQAVNPPAPAEEEVVGGPKKAVEEPAKPGKPGQKDKQLEEEIVVTGSHIHRKDLTTPAPVVVITKQQIKDSGIATVGDYLQTLTQQGGGSNSQFNNPGDGSTQINLRNLGSERTLVLLNGRRMVGYGTLEGVVDLNVIPTAIVDRIEILLDGASGVYGSDAISGVVNIITKKNYTGAEMETYQGISGHGDGYISDYTGTLGVSGDKGSAFISLDFYDQQAVLAANRPYSAQDLQENFLTGQILPLGSTAIPATSFNSVCLPGGLAPPGGTPLLQALCKIPTASGSYKVGGSPLGFSPLTLPNDYYNYQTQNFNQTPAERFSSFASGEYHLTDNVKAYFEGLLASRTAEQQYAPEPIFTSNTFPYPGTLIPATLSGSSMYNPFGVPLNIDVARRMLEANDRQNNDQYWTGRLVAGVTGVIPELKDWTWDVSLNYGLSDGTVKFTGAQNAANVNNALGPSMVVNGVPTCVTQAGNAGTAIPGCVPLNLLGGTGSITPAMLNYIDYTGGSTFTEQLFETQANASGDLFHLWAKNAVALAFGYDYRSERGSYTPDPVQAAGLSTDSNSNPTVGGYYLNEGYAELNMPIISDKPLLQALEAVAAVRFSDYSTFGPTTNYKFGGRWTPIKDFTLRGTVSSGFRAPSISDLYTGLLSSYPSATDPCKTLGPTSPPALAAECAREGVPAGGTNDSRSQLLDITGGNPNLQPEVSDAFTLGAVWEPRWVKNLSLTVDYYNIRVYDTVTTYGPQQIFSECYTGEDPSICKQIIRGAGGLITEIQDQNANVGWDKTDGIDFGLNYKFQLVPSIGAFGLLVNATWLDKFDQMEPDGTIIHGVGTYDLGALGAGPGAIGGVMPDWRFTAGLSWAWRALGASVFERFVGSYEECSDSVGLSGTDGACYQLAQNAQALGVPQSTLIHIVPAYFLTNVNVSYNVKSFLGNTRIQVGINNLFDVAPPVVLDSANTFATDPSAYDTTGRYFYAMLTQKFL